MSVLSFRRIARCGTYLAAMACAAAAPAPGWAQQAPTFRSSTDVIAVDVQVIDRDGQPVAGLTPDQFEVTINGRRRRVISATLLDTAASSGSSTGETEAVGEPPANAPPAPSLARVVVLAIDCISLDAATAREAALAARAFIERSPPSDLIGLFTFPLGPRVDPTTDRLALTRALDQVVGQLDAVRSFEFNLRPSDLVDLAVWADAPLNPLNQVGLSAQLVTTYCNIGTDPVCPQRLAAEVKARIVAYEGQAYASLSMLRGLFVGLSTLPGRKTVVLVSGGVIASDITGGRPDLDELSTQIGKAAAQANVAVYTLFLDRGMETGFQARTGRPMRQMGNFARDAVIAARWLDRFSGMAGGAMIRSVQGTGALEFDRIRTEMSAYYLLGVEPASEDRDGRIHPMRVKVDRRGATVRGRSWVIVPKPGEATPLSMVTSLTGPAPAPRLAPPPAPLPDSVIGVAEAFARGDYATFTDRLQRAPDLANLIRDFRAADPPWPEAPHRASVFALELALAGLYSENGFARDEGVKMLAQAHAVVERAPASDAFECSWYWAEAAALEGLHDPTLAVYFVDRARQRCPDRPRLGLAHGVILEQRWQPGADPRLEQEILADYTTAREAAETALEAAVRAAWLSVRAGDVDRALALLEAAPAATTADDPHVRYFRGLVAGQVHRARAEIQAAESAYREALEAWPGGQTARVALMSLLIARGERTEAAELAEAIQAAGSEQFDPWWTYSRGDFRGYAAIVSGLREMAQ